MCVRYIILIVTTSNFKNDALKDQTIKIMIFSLICKMIKHSLFQGSQFRTVPAGTASIYRSGQCTGTDNPLISYREKYRSYRPRTGCTGEIRLFRPVNGYRVKTSFVRKENKEEGEKEEDDDEAGWRREAIASSSSFLFFFFFSVGLSVSLSFFFSFFFAEPFFLLLLCWSVYIPLPFFIFFLLLLLC